MVATETGYSPFLTSDDVTERMGEVFYGLKLWEGMSPIRREKGRARFLDVMSAAITRSQALDRLAAESPRGIQTKVFVPSVSTEEILAQQQDRIAKLEQAVAELQRVTGNSYSSLVTETYEPFPGVVIQYDPNVPVGEVRVKLKDGE